MKNTARATFAAAITLLSIACAATSAGATEPVTAGNLTIEPGWARASATPVAKAGAAFFTIRNTGAADDTLIGAESAVAGKTEVHAHKHENGIMKMMPAGDVIVPAGGMVMMKPGDLHVMLMGLNAPLKEGGHFEVTLKFLSAGNVTVPVTIMSVAAKGPAVGHGEGHGDGHGHKTHGAATQ